VWQYFLSSGESIAGLDHPPALPTCPDNSNINTL
jgi:hypothetical protein